jgi:chemotaxis protein MotB
MLKWLGLATLSFALTGSLVGCVPQEKYNAKALENSSLTEQLNAAQKERDTAAAEAAAYKSQLDQYGQRLTTEEAMRNNLDAQNKALASQVAELDAKYQDSLKNPPKIEQIMQAGGVGNALPAPLTNALTDFANANPGVVEFDAARGVVKFKSDVTFATGSAILTPEAKSVIDKFATILDSSAASTYDLQVAGHTDNVPVSNPATIAAGHKNNWYLSAHRAISVGSELSSQGVSQSRLAVTGYGDQRPISDNATEAGRRQNRRVEVLILPTRHVGPAITASESSAPVAAPKRVAPVKKEMSKDSAAVEVEPALTK